MTPRANIEWKNMWDKRYSEPGLAYGTEPNEFFRQAIDSMKSGKLLLPGEGEGRNAIYAASRGWNVTALDISEVASKKALEWADRDKQEINHETGGPRIPELLYSEQEIESDFNELQILMMKQLAEDIYEGKYHRGTSEIIRLQARRAGMK